MPTNGARIIVPRAPIADSVDPASVECSSADIYSMFRLVRGYTGFCRRVRRSSDNATLDIGFTAGGLYDIRKELSWAGMDTVYVSRWYNQSPASGRPAFLKSSGTSTDPRSALSGAAVTFRGFPAMEVSTGPLLSEPFTTLGYEEFLSTVWIGGAFFEGDGSIPFGIHSDGYDTNRLLQLIDADPPVSVSDGGPYLDRTGTFTRGSGNFIDATLLATSYEMVPGYTQTAWVNGIARPVSLTGSVSSIAPGPVVMGGPAFTHTFIASGDLGIHDLAKSRFNANNWIY